MDNNFFVQVIDRNGTVRKVDIKLDINVIHEIARKAANSKTGRAVVGNGALVAKARKTK